MEIASVVKHLKVFVSKLGTMKTIMVSIFWNITIYTNITV